jgi:hypothetical protein
MARVLYEANQGPDGKVVRGTMIAEAEAVARRKSGLDIVVCGDDTVVNCQVARAIEDQVGPNYIDGPHLKRAGPHALPHWQQRQPPPEGHSFYETHVRKSFAGP